MGQLATDEQLDAVFGALSHPVRRAMVRRLAQGPARVSELVDPDRMSKPAISRHVAVLERAGLLRRTREGRVHTCSLDPSGLARVHGFLADTRAFWEGNLDALQAFLESDDG